MLPDGRSGRSVGEEIERAGRRARGQRRRRLGREARHTLAIFTTDTDFVRYPKIVPIKPHPVGASG